MPKINLNAYAKAIAAAVAAGYGLYQLAITDGSAAGDGVTAGEWRNIIVATVVTGVLVWAVPNEPRPPLGR